MIQRIPKSSAYFIKRIKNIISKKLSVQDRLVFSLFQNQNLDYAMVFQHWFKYLFKSEFPEPDTCLILDYKQIIKLIKYFLI